MRCKTSIGRYNVIYIILVGPYTNAVFFIIVAHTNKNRLGITDIMVGKWWTSVQIRTSELFQILSSNLLSFPWDVAISEWASGIYILHNTDIDYASNHYTHICLHSINRLLIFCITSSGRYFTILDQSHLLLSQCKKKKKQCWKKRTIDVHSNDNYFYLFNLYLITQYTSNCNYNYNTAILNKIKYNTGNPSRENIFAARPKLIRSLKMRFSKNPFLLHI